MNRRPPRQPHTNDDIFGVPALAMLTASSVRPIDIGTRNRLAGRLNLALVELEKAQESGQTSQLAIDGWRDITDAMNFIQSAVEMKITTDTQSVVPAIKEALYASSLAYERTGAPRLSPEQLRMLAECIAEFDGLIGDAGLSGRDYWRVAIHTQKRVKRLLAGAKKRRGDVVVSL